nr:PQQ-binding-like beta-propeller repeat protein [Enterovirga sp. DB1703]
MAGGRLLLLTPFPHRLTALRLGPEGLHPEWRFTPETDRMAEGTACCGLGVRSPAVAGGRAFLNTADGRTIALDAASGTKIWEMRTADRGSGESLASSPLPVGDKVLIGNAGDDFGVRGWLKALDATSGATLWTRYSTGPDEDVGIGPDFAPFYKIARGRDLGAATWPPGAWERGGGSVSGPLMADTGLGLVFHGTGRPAPLNPDQRPGENRWTSGLFARDLATGAARWFYQLAPHDQHGVSGTGPLILADRDWKGRARKLLIHVGLNGHVYVLDRISGELLSAEAFAPVNAFRGGAAASGAIAVAQEKATRVGATTRDVCPAWTGATSSEGAALSAETGLLFIAAARLCMDIEIRPANYIRGTPYLGANVRVKGPPEGGAGELVAWRLDDARPAWTVSEPYPLLGGPLWHPRGFVIYGTLDGWLKALDARDGRLVWQQRLASGVVSAPMLVRGADGAEYVTVLAGRGGAAGPAAGLEADLRDATAARGFGNLLRGLSAEAQPGGTLYLFALP